MSIESIGLSRIFLWQEPLQQVGGWQGLLGRLGQRLIKDFLDGPKLQDLQVVPDFGQGLLRWGCFKNQKGSQV